MIRVILLIDCASEFDRKLLRGMMRYSKESGPWLFYRMPTDLQWKSERMEWVVEWAEKWHADAIIGRCDDEKLGMLSDLNIPIVLQNNVSRSEIYSNLTGDYIGTGNIAAEYFHKKLFTSFAFFGVRNVIWSEERKSGFCDRVRSYNGSLHVFEEEPKGTEGRETLIEWLKSLPKPTALFCCDDAHALFITETCGMCGLKIPDEISVLGVDNDELLCSISDPPISSIDLDVEMGGYLTCRNLHRQILDNSRTPFNVVINPISVHERQSTLFHNISDPIVEPMIRYMEENYNKNITVADILACMPFSRRSLEMKFRRVMGTSVYQYLNSVRVEHMAFLLSTTDKSIAEIAFEVGFNDSCNIARVFRKFKGCSPQEYRQKNCAF